MKISARHPAPRVRAALRALSLAGSLAGTLSGCLGMGQPQWAEQVARPDPPPIPLRKPSPPAALSSRLTAPAVETAAVTPTRSPVTSQSLTPPRKPSARVRSPVTSVGYRVRPGDTLYGVARRFAVPLRGVIEANRLRPPYSLRVGQFLRVPNPRRHVVQAGDTVHGVSRRYGVDPSQLVRLNAIKPPFAIAPGQHLTLPVGGLARARGATQTAALSTADAASPKPRPAAFESAPAPAASSCGRCAAAPSPATGRSPTAGTTTA